MTAGYGQNNLDFIDRMRLRFCGPLAEGIGDDAFRFIHNPDTKAGWQKPKCPYRLKVDFGAEVEPLAKIELDGESRFVAAVYRPDGNARFVFMPQYLISPYLLTDEPLFSNPARPRLDRIGSTVLLTVLRLLR